MRYAVASERRRRELEEGQMDGGLCCRCVFGYWCCKAAIVVMLECAIVEVRMRVAYD